MLTVGYHYRRRTGQRVRREMVGPEERSAHRTGAVARVRRSGNFRVIWSYFNFADVLVRELEGMRLASVAGKGKLLEEGAEHDDLALALALACWRAKRSRNGFGTNRLPGI
jgi:hypothetical protein